MISSNSRYVSQITRNTLAVVLAGGKGTRLHELTSYRAKAALHFAGKFRLIDFPLSNCINSGIRRIGVATQYRSHSLIRHLVQGWGHLHYDLGEFVELLPASQQLNNNWYKGTVDALNQNRGFIQRENPQYVIVLAGDQVYHMDYGLMLVDHVESGAEMSIASLEVPVQQAEAKLGVLSVDSKDRITAFAEKPAIPPTTANKPDKALASMGIYVFNTDFLLKQLHFDQCNVNSSHDFGSDFIPDIVNRHHVNAYRFNEQQDKQVPYWSNVATLDSYWAANIDLVSPSPTLNLYDKDWPIWTNQRQSPPAKFVFNDHDRRGVAVDSMVAGGCIISGGKVQESMLFENVRVNSFSHIQRSVLLPGAEVGRYAKINKAIIDNGCHIPPNMEVGFNLELDAQRGFRVSEGGVTLVTSEMLL